MSGFVDRTASPVEYLEQMATQVPDLAEDFYTPMATYCRSKLWHQLTTKAMEFVTSPTTKKAVPPERFLELYDKVIMAFPNDLNALAVAQITSHVSNALLPSDPTAARTILENQKRRAQTEGTSNLFAESTTTNPPPSPALLFLESKLVSLQLALDTAVDTNACKEILNAHTKWLVALDETSGAAVHAAHYEAAMAYYKRVGPPQAFYEQGMAFLQYAPPGSDTSSTTNYHQLAVDLVLAALTGDGVYNLGQVEQNPILTVLHNTPDAWLLDVLSACAAGDVTRFDQVTQQHAAAMAQQPALLNRATAVQEKLKLLALVWLVFRKPPHERTLVFDDIATALHVPVDQVEWVLMRAMSVELLKGKIDEVEQTVEITWLLPRVLNAGQMQDLANRLGAWATTVQTTHADVQQQAAPVLG